MPGACYSALRRLPRRDFHPQEKRSEQIPALRLGFRLRHDAPRAERTALGRSGLAPGPPLTPGSRARQRGGREEEEEEEDDDDAMRIARVDAGANRPRHRGGRSLRPREPREIFEVDLVEHDAIGRAMPGCREITRRGSQRACARPWGVSCDASAETAAPPASAGPSRRLRARRGGADRARRPRCRR
jgi:hypothetical protein